MQKTLPFFICILIFAAYSCSKKTQPTRTTTQPVILNDTAQLVRNDTLVVRTNDSLVVLKKPVVKRRPKEVVPQVITVNDNVARKSVDGRLFYDLQGRRYWRSNKDGKYYLFNKSMQSDPAFSKPQ